MGGAWVVHHANFFTVIGQTLVHNNYRAGNEAVNNRDISFIMIRCIPDVGICARHVVDSYRLLLLASQVSL